MLNIPKALFKSILLISVLAHSTLFAHESKNARVPSSMPATEVAKELEAPFDCEDQSSKCAIAMIQNKTGKIKLENVSFALKRQKAQTSVILPLITKILEKELVKDKLAALKKQKLTIAELSLDQQPELFRLAWEQHGLEESENYLGTLRYGDKKLYNDQKLFTPEKVLISPVEQVKFLRRVLENQKITQVKTQQTLESIFKFDKASQLNFMIFDGIQHNNPSTLKKMAPSGNEGKSLTPQWVLGWYNSASDRAYFALYQKDSSAWPRDALLAGIKQWIVSKK